MMRSSTMRDNFRALDEVADGYFDRYAYPSWLRRHSRLVGRTALVIARARAAAGTKLDPESVALAGYLHDVGRSPLLAELPGEHHARSAQVLAAEGLTALVEPARRHPVYALLDAALAPRTIEDKIVNYADRRCAQRLLTVRERIGDVRRRYPAYAAELEGALGAALALEREVLAGIAPLEADLEAAAR